MHITLTSFESLQRYFNEPPNNQSTQLTDEQCLLIEDLFPWEPPSRNGGRRFKRWTESGLFVIAWARLLQELERRANSTGLRRWPMKRLLRQKKRRLCWPDQTRQGNQDHAAH